MFFKKIKSVIRRDWFVSVSESKEEIVKNKDNSYFYPFSSKKYNKIFNDNAIKLRGYGAYAVEGRIIDTDFENGTLKILFHTFYLPFDIREVVRDAYRTHCFPYFTTDNFRVTTISLIGSGLSSKELPTGKKIACMTPKRYSNELYIAPPLKYFISDLTRITIKTETDGITPDYLDFEKVKYDEFNASPYDNLDDFGFEGTMENMAKEEYDICQEIKALKEKEPMTSVYTDEFLRYYIKKMKHRIHGFYLRGAMGADLEEDAIFLPILHLGKYYDKVITICTDLCIARFSELYNKVDGELVTLKSVDDIVLPTKELTEYYIWEKNEDKYNREIAVKLLMRLIQMFKDNPKERYCLIFDNKDKFLPTLFTDDFNYEMVNGTRTYEHDLFDFFFADNRPNIRYCFNQEEKNKRLSGKMPFTNVTWNCLLMEQLPKDKPYFNPRNYYYGFSPSSKYLAEPLYDEFFRFTADEKTRSKIWKNKDTFTEYSVREYKSIEMENMLIFVDFFKNIDAFNNLYCMPEYYKAESYDKYKGREKDKVKNDAYNLFHGFEPPTFAENRKKLGYQGV